MKLLDMEYAKASDMHGIKILRGDNTYGLYVYTQDGGLIPRILYRFIRCVIISRVPFRKGRLLRVAFRKFTVDLYNQVWFSLHKTDLMYGAHIGFIRVIVNRF